MTGLLFILCIHAAFTWLLTGFIWFTQLVHYPLYAKIKEGFHEYEKKHIRRSGYLIGPLMLFEFLTAVFLFGWSKLGIFAHLTSINLVLLILIWISTLLFQINQHQKLAVRFSWKWYHSLIMSNWIRTILWSARAILILALFYNY